MQLEDNSFRGSNIDKHTQKQESLHSRSSPQLHSPLAVHYDLHCQASPSHPLLPSLSRYLFSVTPSLHFCPSHRLAHLFFLSTVNTLPFFQTDTEKTFLSKHSILQPTSTPQQWFSGLWIIRRLDAKLKNDRQISSG